MALKPNVNPGRPQVERVIGPVRLNLDDLDDVYAMLSARTKGKVSIETGSHIADKIGDLVHARDTDLARVSITTQEPWVRVWLSDWGAKIWASGDDVEAERLVEDAARLINRQPTSWRSAFPWFMWGVVLSLACMAGWGSGALIAKNTGDEGAAWMLGVISGVVALVVLCYLGKLSWKGTGGVHIVPERRHERRGLTRQGWRDLRFALLGFGVGILASVISGAVTRYLESQG